MKILQIIFQKMIMILSMMLTPSCETITQQISLSMDEDISFVRRARIRFHLWSCQLCARYKKQLLLLREAVDRLKSDEALEDQTDPGAQLSEDSKVEIKKILHSQN